MAANVSGTVLASLFYDQINSAGDQEGFLLGKVVNHVQDKISDSQISNYKVETVVYVYSYLPWPSENRVYDARGQINPTKAMMLLEDKHKDLIGWYKFRRNSTLRPSLRETNLHQSLMTCMPLDNSDNFLFFLCTSSMSKNKSTHTFDHSLLRHQNKKFQKVAISVINLGDTTHAEYKREGNLTINPDTGSLRTVINRFTGHFVGEGGNMAEVSRIQQMSSTLQEKLQVLSEVVAKSEGDVSCLEEEVKMLSQILQERMDQKRAALKPPSPVPQVPETSLPQPVTISMTSRRTPGVKRSEHSLRVGAGEHGRRGRQISLDDDEVDRREGNKRSPEPSLMDIEIGPSTQKPDDAMEVLQPSVSEAETNEAANSRTSRTRKNKHELVTENSESDKKQLRRRGASNPKDESPEANGKSCDPFSFVSNMMEKETQSVGKANSPPLESHEVEKPTVKRETNVNMNNAGRRPASRAEAQAARSKGDTNAGRTRVNSPSLRTKQLPKVNTVPPTCSTDSDLKGERSQGQRVRPKPVSQRSRSRESPARSQRLGTSNLQGVSRTKSASPSNCRSPLKRNTYENGTEADGKVEDAKLSSSPVF